MLIDWSRDDPIGRLLVTVEYSTQLVPPFYESGTASLYEAVPPFYEKGTGLIPVPFLLPRLQACRVLAHVRPLDI